MVDVVSFNAVLKCLVGGACWSQVGQLDMGPSCPTKEQKLVMVCNGWLDFVLFDEMFLLIGWIFGWLVVFLGWLGCFF